MRNDTKLIMVLIPLILLSMILLSLTIPSCLKHKKENLREMLEKTVILQIEESCNIKDIYVYEENNPNGKFVVSMFNINYSAIVTVECKGDNNYSDHLINEYTYHFDKDKWTVENEK